jgi:hypothetical protein
MEAARRLDRRAPGLRVREADEAWRCRQRHMWDAAFFRSMRRASSARTIVPAPRRANVAWAGDLEQVGWFIHAYKSAWLARRVAAGRRAGKARRCDLRSDAALERRPALQQGPGRCAAAEIAAATRHGDEPAGAGRFRARHHRRRRPPAFPGMSGTPRDPAEAREEAREVGRAMDALREVAPGAGAYVSESDYFQADWESAFWGGNAARLAAVKKAYDPMGCSSCATAWAAPNGARTASRACVVECRRQVADLTRMRPAVSGLRPDAECAPRCQVSDLTPAFRPRVNA